MIFFPWSNGSKENERVKKKQGNAKNKATQGLMSLMGTTTMEDKEEMKMLPLISVEGLEATSPICT